MTTRQVKGINLTHMVIALKNWRKYVGAEGEIPGLLPECQPLFEHERVLSNQWYPLTTMLNLLEITHQLVFAGTEQGLVDLGRAGATMAYDTAHSAYVKSDPASTLEVFPRLWRVNFNFGQLEVENQNRCSTVTLHEYDDIHPLHGKLHVGWMAVLVEKSGGKNARCELVQTPWDGTPPLKLRVSWD